MVDLKGKRALITGAGRGIGQGCARALAQAGADLVMNDRPDSPDLQSSVEEMSRLGVACEGIEADVFSRAGCEMLIDQATRDRPLDIVISNPAWGHREEFLKYDPEDFQRVVNATLISGFHISQLVARHLVARSSPGKIVLVSSVQAEMPITRCVAYAAAKAGVNQMARIMSAELASYRINVNVIQPGWIETPGEHLAFGKDRIEREGPQLPWGRLGTPDDIGRAAAFLASDDADYMTGSIVTVDGGFRGKDAVSD